jgi:hypothetical protein
MNIVIGMDEGVGPHLGHRHSSGGPTSLAADTSEPGEANPREDR